MEYNFEYVLIDRSMVNEFLRYLHRPEPSGYGTVPGKNMNVTWGIHELKSGITFTKSYEEDKKEWKRITGKHSITYDVMSKEGCFGVGLEIDKKGLHMETTHIFCTRTELYEKQYLETVKAAIQFYEKDGIESGAFLEFCKQFENDHHLSLEAYSEQVFNEVYEEWDSKWR